MSRKKMQLTQERGKKRKKLYYSRLTYRNIGLEKEKEERRERKRKRKVEKEKERK